MNPGHIKTIQNALNIKPEKIYSVIVFTGDNKFKIKMPENVRQGIGYIDYIKSKKEKIISKDEISKIISQIEAGRLTKSFKTYRKHIKHVENIVEDKKKNT